ncbi:hypothetical protein CLV94_2450 [Flavobacterium endophyticum]|uniref:DUF1574 domain-containing protein n=1 Tax=Flavobacterium endophyticum TaxID=1540163 RepID=A0A495M946_9FLAO|nr:hypothetical protein [Flavobacterium endophyticum]RKS21815.1 hypothetical protein CLV94_2450 [Flavobacterium endophyticum]
MQQFIRKIGVILLTTVLLLCLFDWAYTEVYVCSIPRNKTKYVLGLKDQKIDYVFLGSSRVENHIDTQLIKTLTSKKVLNLGIQGAKLDDNYLLLQLLIHNNVKIGKLFLQVDYIFNTESISTIVSSESLPYIRKNEIIRNHLEKSNPDYLAYYYLPFYRYQVNDYKIGFREFFSSVISKKSKTDFTDGFVPKQVKFIKNNNFRLPDSIIAQNKVFNQIDQLCKDKNIEVIYFCAPFCSTVRQSDYIDKLKRKIPSLKDYSKTLDDTLFYNCGHLNGEGAKVFTRMLVKDCMQHEK